MSKRISNSKNELYYESSSQREKLFAAYVHQISPVRFNKSNVISYISQEQLPLTKGLHLLKEKTSLKTPSTPKESKSRLGHKRVASMTAANFFSNKLEVTPGSKKDSMPEISTHIIPHLQPDQPFTPKSLHRETNSCKHVSTKLPGSPARLKIPKEGASDEFLKGLSLRKAYDGKEFHHPEGFEHHAPEAIRGVVFSDSKDRYAIYKKRYLALQANSIHESSDALSTPHRKKKSSKESHISSKKSISSKEELLLKEALAQHIPVYPSSRDNEKRGTSRGSSKVFENKESLAENGCTPRTVKTVKIHKRVLSLNQNLLLKSHLEASASMRHPSKEELALMEKTPKGKKEVEEKSARLPSKEEKVKEEQVREGQFISADVYYQEFLETNKLTFDFEKMVTSLKNTKNFDNNNSMYISVASPSARKEMPMHNENHLWKGNYSNKGENLLKSAFTLQGCDEKQVPNSDSTKYGQGSTCQSTKLMRGSISTRKGEKRATDTKEDSDLEKLIGLIESEGERKNQK